MHDLAKQCSMTMHGCLSEDIKSLETCSLNSFIPGPQQHSEPTSGKGIKDLVGLIIVTCYIIMSSDLQLYVSVSWLCA